MRPNRQAARNFGTPSRQRGVVLFIALIVMVAMSLAAVALIRSVDTSSAVIGNLAFRQASILPANIAIENAGAALFPGDVWKQGPTIPDLTADFLALNYYSTRPPVGVPGGCTAANWDDQAGVPCPLQKKATAQALNTQFTDGAGNNVTYLIERMCNPNAPAIPPTHAAGGTWCDMMPPKGSLGMKVDQDVPIKLPQLPFYRVTVRVDGPQNTVSFLQAMLR